MHTINICMRISMHGRKLFGEFLWWCMENLIKWSPKRAVYRQKFPFVMQTSNCLLLLKSHNVFSKYKRWKDHVKEIWEISLKQARNIYQKCHIFTYYLFHLKCHSSSKLLLLSAFTIYKHKLSKLIPGIFSYIQSGNLWKLYWWKWLHYLTRIVSMPKIKSE